MSRTLLPIPTVFALALLLPACIQIGADAPPPVQRHALDVLPPAAPAGGEGTDPALAGALAVREFGARRRYDVRVVRRDGYGDLRFLEYDRWVEEPAEAVTTVVRETLARSGAFEAVTSASAAFDAELVLEGALLAFDVVVDDAGAETARMEVRLDLAEAVGGALVDSGRFTAERPVGGADADEGLEGLGAAMSACAADIVRQALAAWRDAAGPGGAAAR